ncbi:MAG: helix-turn-helix domain-containing protein [Ruminococcus sp.]|jgi:transcriptional regulator with XRE-family HTH domain|nr:helix-turn-helix domain-containing protein [Ruminococcus sp.]
MNMSYQEKFKENLRILLDEEKLSQRRFAAFIQVNQSSISDLLLGVTTPSFKTMMKIVDHFGVSVDWLVGLSDVREPKK